MKKSLLFALLVLGLILSACGNEAKNTTTHTEKEDSKPAEQKEVSNKPDEPTENEDGNIVFTEAGQKAKVDTGTLELLKIKNINETIDIAPIKVTMKDIKIFKMTDMTEDFKENLAYYNDNKNIGDELVYVQVAYDVENTEEKNVDWLALTDVVTDKGQQIDAITNDFLYTDSDGDSEFFGKVKKEFADAYILKESDVSKIKFIFSGTKDSDTFDNITPKQQVEYSI